MQLTPIIIQIFSKKPEEKRQEKWETDFGPEDRIKEILDDKIETKVGDTQAAVINQPL